MSQVATPAGTPANFPLVETEQAQLEESVARIAEEKAAFLESAEKVVAEVLGLKIGPSWAVVDAQPEQGLALAHFSAEANTEEYGWVRGVVVDVQNKVVVARSYGHTNTAIADALVPIPGQGDSTIVSLKDEFGQEHEFPLDRTTIVQGKEGVIIRAFLHRGEVYFSSHRRLNPQNSRFGKSPSFLEMYHSLEGPTRQQLFHPEAMYSPWCYIFMVVHPSLLLGTRQDVGSGYISYLGAEKVWQPDQAPAHWVGVEGRDLAPEAAKAPLADFPASEEIGPVVSAPFIHAPPALDLDSANKILQWGYYSGKDWPSNLDQRQNPGEFLYLYLKDAEGRVLKTLRVNSTSYEWRLRLRDGNPNLKNRFYQLVNFCYADFAPGEAGEPAFREFKKTFILFPLMSEDSLAAQVKNGTLYLAETATRSSVVVGRSTRESLAGDRDKRLQLIAINFVISLPLHVQAAASEILSEFRRERGELVEWIYNLCLQNENIESRDDVRERVKAIAKTAHRNAVQQASNSKSRSKVSVNELTKSNIRKTLHLERGTSLYKMVVDMKLEQCEGTEDLRKLRASRSASVSRTRSESRTSTRS